MEHRLSRSANEEADEGLAVAAEYVATAFEASGMFNAGEGVASIGGRVGMAIAESQLQHF
jgi:hypothetical protein